MNQIKDIVKQLDTIVNSTSKEHQNLQKIFNNIKVEIISELINYYLFKINNDIYKDIDLKKVDSKMKFFDLNTEVSDFDTRKLNYSIMEEANIIVDDLIKKLKKSNNRSITLPIDINYLIQYSISNYINNRDVDRVLYYVLIKIAIIYNLYK